MQALYNPNRKYFLIEGPWWFVLRYMIYCDERHGIYDHVQRGVRVSEEGLGRALLEHACESSTVLLLQGLDEAWSVTSGV